MILSGIGTIRAKGGRAVFDAVELTDSLRVNLDIFRARLNAPDNMDVLLRRFRSGAFESALLAIDGMCDKKEIDEQVLQPCMDLPESAGEQVPEGERAAWLMAHAVSILPMKMKTNIDEIISDALSGQSVLICEGCKTACVMDTRGFEKRTIGKPEAERVVLGPHESFSESIRTNITLLRRIVQREELITEFISVGGKMKTRCALLYLRGTADEAMLARIRRRLSGVCYDFAMTTGEIEQFIEDRPFSLIPSVVRTERPDRAASFLAEGQVVILTDGSPAALGAPATLWHQLHTPDDTHMRWQYGTFLRAIRLLGVLIHVLLPGVFLALLRFHQDLFSPMLLTSVYETGSRVPVPVFLEALLMTLAFNLISEAGLRAPGTLGNALGIVSGLILGQSAVSADIVSPLLLIVVAASGLGGFCVPNYALSIGLKIVQLIVLCAGAAGGLYMIALVLLALTCALFGMQSLPSPLTAPAAPPRRKNMDLLVRLPLRWQRAQAFFAAHARKSDRVLAAWRVHAAAAAVMLGAGLYALGALAAMPLCLNSAWLAALAAVPAVVLTALLSRRALLRRGKLPRAAAALIALTQLATSVFLFLASVSLARETLLPLARGSFILLVSAGFLILCAFLGAQGAARLTFAQRFFLPAVLLLLSAKALYAGDSTGLFPLLGAGARQTALSAAAMLPAALAVFSLALPPPVLEQLSDEDYARSVPRAGFFIRRLLAGAAVAVLLLTALSLCSTYEGIAGLRSWGERMIILSYGAPREGIPGTLLTLLQILTFALSAVNALLAAVRATGLLIGKRGDAA